MRIRDFLPRGTGIVTRRPLVLQLYCTGQPDMATEEMEANREDSRYCLFIMCLDVQYSILSYIGKNGGNFCIFLGKSFTILLKYVPKYHEKLMYDSIMLLIEV